MNEINEILHTMQARCDGATKGPWNADVDDDYLHQRLVVTPDDTHIVAESRSVNRDVANSAKNFSFIAHARTDTPHLVAALREAVGALEGLHEYWNRDPNENAMHDACENTIEVADRTLATIAKLLKGEKP